MLDDSNVIKQKDPEDALWVAGHEYAQARFPVVLWNENHDGRKLDNVVVVGMGGSALAALLIKAWLKDQIKIPFEVVRSYDLPAYVGNNTLVVASSYSGNTEEVLSSLEQAEVRGAQIAIVSAGGQLADHAASYTIAYAPLPDHIDGAPIPDKLQPRMAVFYQLRATLALLANFGVVSPDTLTQIEDVASWLEQESARWAPDVPTERNYAKQLANQAVGKTPIFYGGALTAPVAYKWKISFNETAKNMAFWNEYSEFNHNEFLGWVSHPVEKPFAVFDIISDLEHPQILKRFEISDRLLSGKRPKATIIKLAGDTPIAQMMWGSVLADFTSIYTAILNGVDPTPVEIIEKLKHELV